MHQGAYAQNFHVVEVTGIEDSDAWNERVAEIQSPDQADAVEDDVLLHIARIGPRTARLLAIQFAYDLNGFDPFDPDFPESGAPFEPNWYERELLSRRVEERKASDWELRLRGMSSDALDAEIKRLEQLVPHLLRASIEGKALAHSLAPHLIGHPLAGACAAANTETRPKPKKSRKRERPS